MTYMSETQFWFFVSMVLNTIPLLAVACLCWRNDNQ
jgi:hypothetical protein